jgi:hypothetical protein
MLWPLLLAQALAAAGALSPAEILARVTEEAEMLRQNASKSITEETLQQRAALPPSRFRPGPGGRDVAPPAPRLHTREIVSEYSVGTLREKGDERLMEFRQVISVDGNPIQSSDAARHTLTLGMRSSEDRIRKKMLEDYERHGLVGAVTDFGILLLQFTKQGIRDLTLTPKGRSMIGPDPVVVFEYHQSGGTSGVLDFSNRKATRYPMHGLLFARESDGVPMRVTVAIRRFQNKHDFIDEGTVDYAMSAHGFVAPTSVVHRRFIDQQLAIENHFRYEPFRTFGADTEIKFTEVPDPPPAPKP